MLEENAPEIAETAAVEPAPEAVPVNVIDVQSDEFKALVMSDEVQEIAMNLIRGEQARGERRSCGSTTPRPSRHALARSFSASRDGALSSPRGATSRLATS